MSDASLMLRVSLNSSMRCGVSIFPTITCLSAPESTLASLPLTAFSPWTTRGIRAHCNPQKTTPTHSTSVSDLTMTHLHMRQLRVSILQTQHARQHNSASTFCSTINPHRQFNTTSAMLSLISSSALHSHSNVSAHLSHHTS